MEKEWIIQTPSDDLVKNICRELAISELAAKVLVNRGIASVEEASSFLKDSIKNLPSPFLLKDMDVAVDRIMSAMENAEKIYVYGDYDVDGTVGTSLLVLFFREIKSPLHFYIPHRLKEGYSLNSKALEHLKNEGARLVITVDNGISSVKEIDFANSLGLDVIVTDHHEVPLQMPRALAVVNPKRSDCDYPSKSICGSGVVFNLLLALRQKLREKNYFKEHDIPEPNMKKFMDLLAVATVADVVELTGVNRVFVKTGLEQMSSTVWPGLKALLSVAQIKGELDAYHLGFRLGPRINACGRLYEASAGVRLLTTFDWTVANELALQLNAANEERQEIEKNILVEALLDAEKLITENKRVGLVLSRDHWHPGVIGIVASRVVEKFACPVIILGREGDMLKGSARSVGFLNMVELLRECDSLLLKYGGHKAAAGMSLLPENLAAFCEAFDQAVKKTLGGRSLLPKINIDTTVSFDEINFKLLDEIKALKPFGQGNPEPVFCLYGIRAQSPKLVGQKHLKFSLTPPSKREKLDAIYFGAALRLDECDKNLDLVFSPQINEYMGNQSIVLNIKDLKSAK